MSSAYLRLLIVLPSILTPACTSSSPSFLMMYSEYKLNKQGDNIQPWHTSFPIWNQSVLCLLLTVASWPAYRFLKRQVRWSGIPISFRIFQFIVNPTVQGFGIVNKAEIDVFLELSCFFNDPATILLGISPKELKTYVHKNLNTDVYSSFTHSCQCLEATKIPVSRWID